MHTKKNASFLIIVALSMLILAYVTFSTVYKQILSKSNGFFNAILFGVVLILVFIFITLLARVITITPDNDETSPILGILGNIGVIAIFAIFAWLRLRYTSSVSTSESFTFRAAEYLANNTLAEGSEIHNHLIGYPADFVYSLFVSLVFKVTGSSAGAYTMVNLAMMLITAIFIFNTVDLISVKACAVFAVILFMFMPNNSALVYSYNSELFITASLMIVIYLYEILIYKRFKSETIPALIAIIMGLFSGICISAEPVLIIAFIVMSLFIVVSDRQSAFCVVVPHVISVVITGIIAIVKANLMQCEILEVLKGIGMCFVPSVIRNTTGEAFTISGFFTSLADRFNDPSRFMNDNFYFLTNVSGKPYSSNQAVWLDIADQLIYIFMLILCVLCIVYMLRVSFDKIMTSFGLMISLFVCQILGGMNSVNCVYFFTVVIIIGSSTLYYLYLNHHNEYASFVINREIEKDLEIKRLVEGDEAEEEEQIEEEHEEIDEEALLRSKSLIFIGENDELYEQIKLEEKQSRLNNTFVATKIKTTVDDEGEYNSVEESVEYFDELDEIKTEKVEVHEVTAIPSTRPVDIVKPVLAEEYYDADQIHSQAQSQGFVFRNKATASINASTPKSVEEQPYYLDDDDNSVVENSININSFKDKKNKSEKPKQDKVKPEKVKPEKVKQEKPKQEKTKHGLLNKKEKSLDDIKPGEPLPNPLEGPKKHEAKSFDFDFDVSDGDDYDY